MNQTATAIHPLAQRIRNLVLAAAASVAILAVPATQAYAAAPEQPNLCHGYTSAGNHEFFLPGERVKGADGKWYFCGQDGNWYPYYGTLSLRPTNPTTPKLTAILVPQGTATLAR